MAVILNEFGEELGIEKALLQEQVLLMCTGLSKVLCDECTQGQTKLLQYLLSSRAINHQLISPLMLLLCRTAQHLPCRKSSSWQTAACAAVSRMILSKLLRA